MISPDPSAVVWGGNSSRRLLLLLEIDGLALSLALPLPTEIDGLVLTPAPAYRLKMIADAANMVAFLPAVARKNEKIKTKIKIKNEK